MTDLTPDQIVLTLRALWWRIRYTWLCEGYKWFGWRAAWEFSGEWIREFDEWRELSPDDCISEDVSAGDEWH